MPRKRQTVEEKLQKMTEERDAALAKLAEVEEGASSAADEIKAKLKRAEGDLTLSRTVASRQGHTIAELREQVRLQQERIHTLETKNLRQRNRLPDERRAITRRFEIKGPDGIHLYATTGEYSDGRPGELFIAADKVGALAHGAFDACALAISIGLQHGVPLKEYTTKLKGMRFEPAGNTGDERYPTCTSVLDLVARWLEDRYVAMPAAAETSPAPNGSNGHAGAADSPPPEATS